MKKFFKITLIVGLVLILVASIFMFFFIGNIMNESRTISLDKEKLLASTRQLKVYDEKGMLISNTSTSGQQLVGLDELNEYTVNAFISIEDKEFYNHNGLNYKRIAKAMLNNIKSLSFKEGASTISQQLIKNTHLTNEKTIKRKIKEMILTKKLESQYDKDTILETYLNVIYFGDGCYGIEEASQHYFNKSAKDLNLSESCTLASLIKSPANFSPIHNPENALKRRNLVLSEMKKDGYITDEEYTGAINSEINLNLKEKIVSDNSLYFRSVINEACEILNISEKELAVSGYAIETYYNQNVQNSLVNSIKNGEKHVNSHGNIADELGVVINNLTGGIQAFYGESEYDLVNVIRQPGSAIKPALVYSPALEEGLIHNCSEILDDKIDINGYSPNNVGNTFNGYVNIRKAVAKSLNIPAVKLMDDLGVENCKKFAEKLGIKFDSNDNGLALALGGFTTGVTLKDLTNSYIPYSNNGKFIKSGFIKEIRTSAGVVLYKKDEVGRQVMGSDTAYLMTDLLISGVKEGTSKKLCTLPYMIAGKTGTVAVPNTNLNTDAYSIGYTTKHTAGIWIGNYTNSEEYHLEGKNNGGTYATEHLKNVFSGIYSESFPAEFVVPDTIETAEIDIKELEEKHIVSLADENCPDRYKTKEIFAKRYLPTSYSTTFSEIEKCDFEVINNNDNAVIIFNASDYITYELYCNEKLLKVYEEADGQQEFVHKDLKANEIYTYKIISKNKNNKLAESDEISIITKNKFDVMIENQKNTNNENIKNKNLSWYFY